MQRHHRVAAIAATAILMLSGTAVAQQQPPPTNMTFFISSVGSPFGANFGGIDGADRHCQMLAARVGAGGRTWRAYVSQQALDGKPAINARDRIGTGPWVNSAGVQIAANLQELHTPAMNKINTETGLSESGRMIPSRLFVVNQHDILTGTLADGTAPAPDKDMTCGNWTKGGNDSQAMVGHHDRMGLRDDDASRSWNASHPSRGCNPGALVATGGAGLLYCFAAN